MKTLDKILNDVKYFSILLEIKAQIRNIYITILTRNFLKYVLTIFNDKYTINDVSRHKLFNI